MRYIDVSTKGLHALIVSMRVNVFTNFSIGHAQMRREPVYFLLPPVTTMKTSPTLGVIEFAPDFVSSLNIQQLVVFGSVQPHRRSAGAGGFS